MSWVGGFGEPVEISFGFNTIIRDEFTVPFRGVLPPHKQADNHREADFQLALPSLTQIRVFICPPSALICHCRVDTSHVIFKSLEIKCFIMKKSC